MELKRTFRRPLVQPLGKSELDNFPRNDSGYGAASLGWDMCQMTWGSVSMAAGDNDRAKRSNSLPKRKWKPIRR